MDGLTIDITGANELMAILNELPKTLHDKIVQEYVAEASECYNRAESDAPVGETGDLSGSGFIELTDNGPGEFYVDVGFGDGQETSTAYNYPLGEATTNHPADSLEARGYTWFVELGHYTLAGTLVAPQPYLGPNFDSSVDELMHTLDGLV